MNLMFDAPMVSSLVDIKTFGSGRARSSILVARFTQSEG